MAAKDSVIFPLLRISAGMIVIFSCVGIPAAASPLPEKNRLLDASSQQTVLPHKVQSAEESSLVWQEEASRLKQDPVDAQIDRVWKAIPGLAGWKLNVKRSKRATAAARDGRIHLFWDKVSPRIQLSDLPAEPIYRGPKQEKSVTLMFNVSWGEEYLPQILKTLQATKTRATFFLDARWVESHPDLALKLVHSGQDIGSHGEGHPDFRKLSDEQLRFQVNHSARQIRQITGRSVSLIAPPAGSYDERLVKIAHNQKMYVILWTVDTIDWRRPPAAQIIRRVENGVEPGALILMHPTVSTAEALPTLIQSLTSQGYVFKTVTQVTSETPVAVPPSVLSGHL